MNQAGYQILSFLQEIYHPGDQEALFRFLAERPEPMAKMPHWSVPTDVRSLLLDRERFIERIHYSWWMEPIKNSPTFLQPYLLGSLPEIACSRLALVLKIDPPSKPLSPIAKRYFLRFLMDKLFDPHLPPPTLLPSSELLPLVGANKKEILEVIDFLGLYDIAEEILQIVDKKNLAALHHCLSAKKRSFLKQCLQHKERVSLSKLGLEHWSGEKKKLDDAIHRRGLFRFGKALQQESSGLIWYVTHSLDRGRAKIIEQYYHETGNRRVQEILFQELLTVLSFLRIGRQN